MGDKGNSRQRPANPTPKPTKEQRRREGEARNAEWRKLAPDKQLAILDAVLGKGIGAKKQRAQIAGRVGKS